MTTCYKKVEKEKEGVIEIDGERRREEEREGRECEIREVNRQVARTDENRYRFNRD